MGNDEETGEDNIVFLMSHALHSSIITMIEEGRATPDQFVNILCNSIWGLIMSSSDPKDVVNNMEASFSIIKKSYKAAKATISDAAWKHFAEKNGVGNS